MTFFVAWSETPNGLRYRLVGGTRKRHFDGTSSKPHKLLENAQTPTSRVHAVLGSVCWMETFCIYFIELPHFRQNRSLGDPALPQFGQKTLDTGLTFCLLLGTFFLTDTESLIFCTG